MNTTEAIEHLNQVVLKLGEYDAGKFMVDPETADPIKAILVLEKAIEAVKKNYIEQIKTAASAIDPYFKGIQGGGVRASYRATGAAFKITNLELAQAAGVTKTVHSIDATLLKEYQKVNGKSIIPEGIEPVTERSMSLVLGLSGATDED